MKPLVWLRSAEETWVERATDDQGTLSIFRIAARINLRLETLLFGRLEAYDGITIEEIRQVCGPTGGESAVSAMLVEGTAQPAAHPVGRIALLSAKTWLEQALARPDFNFGSWPSSVDERRRLWPMGFSWWDDLFTEAHAFCLSQDITNRIHSPFFYSICLLWS